MSNLQALASKAEKEDNVAEDLTGEKILTPLEDSLECVVDILMAASKRGQLVDREQIACVLFDQGVTDVKYQLIVAGDLKRRGVDVRRFGRNSARR